MLLKTKFFIYSTLLYFLAIAVLFIASFEFFSIERERIQVLVHHLEFIAFFLITLIFISSNILVSVFYNKIKKKFRRAGALEDNEKEQAEVIHRKLSSFLNYLQEAVLIVGSSGEIVQWNKVAEKLLMIKFKEERPNFFNCKTRQNQLIIERCESLIHKALINGCVFRDSFKVGKANMVYLDVIAAPILGQDKVALIIQDNSSNYKILDLGKDFIANASHELRTPITIIEGFAETLRDLPSVSQPMLVDMTDKIIRSCKRMNALVKNLLTLADLDNVSDIALTSCDLVALIEDCSYLLLSIHKEACIEVLQNESEIYIEANPDLLQQAIMNLFENAVKYSPSLPHITVTIKKEIDYVTLRIEDRGSGIAQEDLSQIFNRFYRVNKDRSREKGGTGLGLSIVQSILEKHKVDVTVTSDIGSGTAFSIRFPSPAYVEA